MKQRVSPTIVVVVLLIVVEALNATNPKNQFYRTYKCVKGNHCRRTDRPIETIDTNYLRSNEQHTSLGSCRLVCGDTAGLWPIPRGLTHYSKNYVRIDPLNIYIDTEASPISTRSFLSEASAIFTRNLQLTCGPRCERINTMTTIKIGVETDKIELDWNTDESYKLYVTTEDTEVHVIIVANTIYGARHALETLSQLAVQVITPGNGRGLVILDRASINDSPAFTHRGLMIDTARNFLSIDDIKRTIDGLASTKMNILHWHATDSQSFPIEIKRRPLMARYGAYSPEMIYTLEDIREIMIYAKFRGIRIILELDSPSHVGAGWEWGPSEGLGELAVCVNQQPFRNYCWEAPCGQINPVNPNTYKVLRDIYLDVIETIGNNSILHLGGDEVFINCWNSTAEITDAMSALGMGRTTDDFLKLWGNFHKEQGKILDEVKDDVKGEGTTILWSSDLTSPEIITRYLDKNRYVVQTWVPAGSTIPEELLKLGYRLVISTKDSWYLDHGFWGNTRYHSWRDAYNNQIPRVQGVLGGEACMWGEYVDGGGLDTKVWPRAAAVAERLWSDPQNMTTLEAEPRLQSQRSRLETRGIYADALTPEWCSQHERMCT